MTMQWSKMFTEEPPIWGHVATSMSIDPDDFGYSPFAQRGGLGKAHQLFGEHLSKLLNEVLAA